MVKPNYGFAKRQRELAKKQKKEEKKQQKAPPPDVPDGESTASVPPDATHPE